MGMVSGLLALVVAAQTAPCDAAVQKSAELRKEYEH